MAIAENNVPFAQMSLPGQAYSVGISGLSGGIYRSEERLRFRHISYEITGRIDVADRLIIRGPHVQWHHPGAGAAVGRHSGRNDPTVITSISDGATNMVGVNWTPTWPEPVPAQIRYEAYSSIFRGLSPALPAGGIVFVTVSVLNGRGSAVLEQFPSEATNWTLVVRFADGLSGSAPLAARIEVISLSLELIANDAREVLIR